MKCPSCSVELPDTANFCPLCGYKMGVPPKPAQPAQPAEPFSDSGRKKSVFAKHGPADFKDLEATKEAASGKDMLKVVGLGVLALVVVILIVVYMVTKRERDEREALKEAKEHPAAAQVAPPPPLPPGAAQQPAGPQPVPAPLPEPSKEGGAK